MPRIGLVGMLVVVFEIPPTLEQDASANSVIGLPVFCCLRRVQFGPHWFVMQVTPSQGMGQRLAPGADFRPIFIGGPNTFVRAGQRVVF